MLQELRKWRKKKPKNNDLLAQIENQILDQQSLFPSQQDHNLQQHLHDKHQDLMAKEEQYHSNIINRSGRLQVIETLPSFTMLLSRETERTESPTSSILTVLTPPHSNLLTPSSTTSLIFSPLNPLVSSLPSTPTPIFPIITVHPHCIFTLILMNVQPTFLSLTEACRKKRQSSTMIYSGTLIPLLP